MVQEASTKVVPIIPGFEELDVGTHTWGKGCEKEQEERKRLPRRIPQVHLHDTETNSKERKYDEMDVCDTQVAKNPPTMQET